MLYSVYPTLCCGSENGLRKSLLFSLVSVYVLLIKISPHGKGKIILEKYCNTTCSTFAITKQRSEFTAAK